MVRKSELRLAQWVDVHDAEGEWHIPREHSKTGKPHIVYLSRQAVDAFRELRALAGESGLVMAGRSSQTRAFAHNAMNVALRTVLTDIDLPTFTIHDLRRTASTLLHENGWPSDVVEKALNHMIGGVRGVYNRAGYAEQRRQMLRQWGDLVEGLVRDGTILLGRFVKTA